MVRKFDPLSKTRLEKLRRNWENDPRNGYTWLIRENKLVDYVSAAQIKEIANEQGWQKKEFAQPQRYLTNKQKKFIKLQGIVPDKQALEIAGYSKSTAAANVRKTLLHELKEQADRDLELLDISREQMLKYLASIVFYDVNNIVQIRRVPCPFCYSENGEPLISPYEYYQSVAKINETNATLKPNERIPIPPKPTKWYDSTLPPNKDCPNCHGNGKQQHWQADTRELDAVGKMVFNGVKLTNIGPEIQLFDRNKAWDMLCKALRIYEDTPAQVQVNNIFTQAMTDRFNKIMQASRERQERIRKERQELLVEDAEVIQFKDNKADGNR